MTEVDKNFTYKTEEFGQYRILRYQIPGFEQLSERKKILLYYLYKASLSGRDIAWDQNCRYNLYVRNILEYIYKNQHKLPKHLWGDLNKFTTFLKEVWVNNGIHDKNSGDKLVPEFSRTWLRLVIELGTGLPKTQRPQYTDIYTILFDKDLFPKRTCRDSNVDKVKNSAVNFYQNITEEEVKEYYKEKMESGKNSSKPISYGLNTKLVKDKDSKIVPLWVSEHEQKRTVFSDEKVTSKEDLIHEISFSEIYASQLGNIYHWLSLAMITTESSKQRSSLLLLSEYLESGDLNKFNDYCIAWLEDDDYDIDIIGPAFVETYNDPLDYTGTFEAIVTVRDQEASKRMEILCENAQWFEDNSPVLKKHKKKEAKGINARVVNVVAEVGDASPQTFIGVNLPNADWIRKEYGSKSINMDNIINAYDAGDKNSGSLEEFYRTEEIRERIRKHGDYAYKIEVDLHEVLGHGSGQLESNVEDNSLKEYSGVIEEARADLFALYYIADPKMIELGILSTEEEYKSVYDMYITGSLIYQLRRVKLGENLSQTHMRNRQMICMWLAFRSEDDNVIKKVEEDGKTYYEIHDYTLLRKYIGELLKEVQRIKSEGDYGFAMEMVEFFGTGVNEELHKEVLERYAKLGIKPKTGFINPKLELVDGKVELSYLDNFAEQMLEYSREY